MGTEIRPELSEKNEYYLPKNRYYELKYFCFQYPDWYKAYHSIDSYSKGQQDVYSYTGQHGDPTMEAAAKRELYFRKMNVVEQTAFATDSSLASYILKGVTSGASYDFLKARLNIPCGRSTYYKFYRRFFWLLDTAQNKQMML